MKKTFILMALCLGGHAAAADLLNVPKGQTTQQFATNFLRTYFGPNNTTVTYLWINEMFVVRKDESNASTFIFVQMSGVFGNRRQIDLDRSRACGLQVKRQVQPQFYKLAGNEPVLSIMPSYGEAGPDSITKNYIKVRFSSTQGKLRNVAGCGADMSERAW